LTPVVAARTIVLTGGTLIDGTGNPPVPDSRIVIRDETFMEVGPASGSPLPRHSLVVDTTGKWIIPGFVDAHVHVESKADPKTMIRWGVTSARLMAEDVVKARKSAQQSRSLLHSPDFFPAAPIFTVPGGWWSEEPPDRHLDRFPQTPEAARTAVARARELGSSEIKIMDDDMAWCRDPLPRLPRIDPAVFSALVSEARRSGLRVSVHAPEEKDARQAVTAGATLLAHGVLDEQIDPEMTSQMKARGIFYVPTLDIFDFLADPREFVERALADRRISASLPKKTLARYRSEAYLETYARRYPNREFVAAHLRLLYASARSLKEAGVPVALGTDMWAFPGAGVHLELEDFVTAGFSPLEAIRAATLVSAQSLAEESRRGTIEVGRLADFIILENDPLTDIRNTRSIESVYKHGRLAWSRFRAGSIP
jgi:imidazolonepropionase-like amidohydrolase